MYGILSMVINMDINLIKGVGSKSIELLSKMNLLTVNDLIMYYPYRYNVIRVIPLSDAIEGEVCTIKGIVDTEPRVSYINKGFNRMSFKVRTDNYLIKIKSTNDYEASLANLYLEKYADRIENIDEVNSYKEKGISIEIVREGRSPVVAKTIDAVLFQVFINLFDNALYWLSLQDSKREVKIYLNSDEQTVTFSDNGPGIMLDDAPFVFDAFYSGKGEEGRGLGLYIAKILLNRYKYNIELITDEWNKKLPGANFKITFIADAEEE